ncbi:MAG: CvpA family protein [Dehalococcoidia bacterium]|nr:CvpA family protein [Dehalococcoidia bacterium]
MEVPAYASIIIDIIVALILVFSFLGGLKQGAPRELCGLLAFIVALSITGAFIAYVFVWMSFASDNLWRSLLTFLITMAIIMIVLHLALLLPRHLLDKIWSGGFFWSVLGGIFSVINSALGLVLMVLLLGIYPVLDWLNDLLAASGILNWLVSISGSGILYLMHMTGTY